MTTMFDDRESAFEAKFAHDEERRFLAVARRDKLFALWATEQLHLSGAARDTLIRDVLSVQGFPNHDVALLRLIAEAFAAAGADPADAAATLHRLGDLAHEQVLQPDVTPIDLSTPG